MWLAKTKISMLWPLTESFANLGSRHFAEEHIGHHTDTIMLTGTKKQEGTSTLEGLLSREQKMNPKKIQDSRGVTNEAC